MDRNRRQVLLRLFRSFLLEEAKHLVQISGGTSCNRFGLRKDNSELISILHEEGFHWHLSLDVMVKCSEWSEGSPIGELLGGYQIHQNKCCIIHVPSET